MAPALAVQRCPLLVMCPGSTSFVVTGAEETDGCISRSDAGGHKVERYRNEYLLGLRPFLKKHGADVLAAGFDAEAAEGESPNSTVVLRVSDAAVASGLFNDHISAGEADPVQHHRARTGRSRDRIDAGRVNEATGWPMLTTQYQRRGAVP
jgi:uncharacterized protein (DUF1330 family)